MTNNINLTKRIATDSMLQPLGKEAADSLILSGYKSSLEAEAITRAKSAGYTFTEPCPSGEFAVDLIGESGKNGGFTASNCVCFSKKQIYTLPSSHKVATEETAVALHLDVNGSPRRAAAQLGLVNVKPTVGTVSGYGCIPVCRSSDTVTVTARNLTDAKELLSAISGADEKDPLTAPKNSSDFSEKTVKRLSLALWDTAPLMKEKYRELFDAFNSIGTETAEITVSFNLKELFDTAHSAWNVILCAELSSNLYRFDGIHFGRRSESSADLNETYIRSRSEGFGKLVKAAILYGSYAVSESDSGGLYRKATAVRETVRETVKAIFETVDAIVIPACSSPVYTADDVENGRFTAFNENLYTALPSLLGLPTVTVHGAQIIGRPYSDNVLIDLAEKLEVNGK